MAKPIEPTPTLKGRDAERLLKSVTKPVRNAKRTALLRASDETYRKLAKK
ncbi:MAG: hypothetical protein HY876_06055 [Coriobacteriales bacterium]|nr:hypothetical protein [Coriobacteriales bacterium]